jgi:hypothetical protein
VIVDYLVIPTTLTAGEYVLGSVLRFLQFLRQELSHSFEECSELSHSRRCSELIDSRSAVELIHSRSAVELIHSRSAVELS